MSTTRTVSYDASILARVVKPNRKGMSPELAQALLQLEFDQSDRARMHQLSVKAKDGSLAPNEEDEIESYRRIGYFLDLLRSKARKALKKPKAP